ncbi:MAG: M23 family metallopeptidase [Longimicrobiales bacterium]|nr:M23 family metallopeptidase [Longimicrobiales bacterium]
MRTTAPAPLLAALISVLLPVGAPGSAEARQAAPAPSEVPGATLSWRPSTPAQGRLVALRVQEPPGRPLRSLSGRGGGETLHFHAVGGGAWESLVPVAVDASGDLIADVELTYRDGGRERLRHAAPVASGDFRHERLTVAPQFGRPPTEEEAARRARDVARARAVSETAHRTPRLWTPEVVLPRSDRVTSGFGNGREFNGRISSRHMGLDLDGETGDTVYAATRGVVALADEFLLAGNVVYLNHGAGLVTGYFHLSRTLAAAGDTVRAGTPIGLVGATGRVTGPHLHWVVRYGHVSVDPESLLEVAGGR